MILVVTFCVFPCAANTESHKHDRLGKYVPSKTSTKVAPEVEVTVVPLAKEEDEALSSSPTQPAQGDVSNEQPKEAPTSSAPQPALGDGDDEKAKEPDEEARTSSAP